MKDWTRLTTPITLMVMVLALIVLPIYKNTQQVASTTTTTAANVTAAVSKVSHDDTGITMKPVSDPVTGKGWETQVAVDGLNTYNFQSVNDLIAKGKFVSIQYTGYSSGSCALIYVKYADGSPLAKSILGLQSGDSVTIDGRNYTVSSKSYVDKDSDAPSSGSWIQTTDTSVHKVVLYALKANG